MRMKRIRYRWIIRFVTKLKDGNGVRLVILSGLVAVAAAGTLVTSCKSRYGLTNQAKEGAEISNNATPKTIPETPTVTTTTDTNSTTTPASPGNNQEAPVGTPVEPAPSTPGGPIAGIEAWQDGKIVTAIVTGKSVVFKPTAWTRDTSEDQGCEVNRGIVQASWTMGSKSAVDIQRFAGQECKDFDYSGMFTKPGSMTVHLDVIAVDGEQAHAEVVFPVSGDSLIVPVEDQAISNPTDHDQTPTQQ
jgi:hypothetical protein